MCVCVWVCVLCTRVTAADENCKWNLTRLGQSELGELQLRSAPALARTSLARHEVLRSLYKSTLSTCNSCSTHTQTHLFIHPRVPERGELQGMGLFGLSQQSQVSKLHVIASTLFALSLSSFLSLYLCPSPSTSVCDAIKVSNLSCACLCVCVCMCRGAFCGGFCYRSAKL